MSSQIRVRFAPSPTGNLHIGSLRSALFNWLFARHHKGTFLLRIEDTDPERSKEHFLRSILDAFSWIGIVSDEPIVTQSHRISMYQKIAQELLDKKLAYRCYCASEKYIQADTENYRHYPGTCRKYEHEILDKPYAIRFKLPNNVPKISFQDVVRGEISINIDQLDDFIIIRSDGMPMYNFAVVVDDEAMKISHVIRGEEHIVNTPKQILLYQACNYQIPAFAHIPLILGPSGEKLSKRDGALSVLEYKKMGYVQEALISYLARLGWSHGDQEIFTTAELIEYFSLEHVGKKGSIFYKKKLAWVNKTFIEKMDGTEILERIQNDLERDVISICQDWSKEQILQTITLLQDRVYTLLELTDQVENFYKGSFSYDNKDILLLFSPQIFSYFKEIIEILKNNTIFEKQHIASLISTVVKKNNIGFALLAKPLRFSLMGALEGPSLADLILILGTEETIKRIERGFSYGR
jgi:glutamyl-tRNA synthetase